MFVEQGTGLATPGLVSMKENIMLLFPSRILNLIFAALYALRAVAHVFGSLLSCH